MKNKLTSFLKDRIANLYSLDLPLFISNTKDSKFGDYTTNILFSLEKQVANFDRDDFFTKLSKDLPSFIDKVEFTKNGFINFYLDTKEFLDFSLGIITDKNFGSLGLGKNKKILLEFVSANPTGPLHIGHGRGAVLGDALGNILSANGYEVSREYYINDAGRQMDILTTSVWIRYLQHFGRIVNENSLDGFYQGEYIIDISERAIEKFGSLFNKDVGDASFKVDSEEDIDALIVCCKKSLGNLYDELKEFTLAYMLSIIKGDLASLNVNFDRWFSEKSLFESGKVEKFVESLYKLDLSYEKDGAIWFKSSSLGDEKDRVMRRANGEYTYFASDIAYHIDKYERGYDLLINIWGADHHGYIKRVKNSLNALGKPSEKLKIKLLQFVSLVENGEKISMSTRKANFVDVRELVGKVGINATRFFYCIKDSDQPMEFDLAKAVAENNDNPVWYIQYALARINAIVRKKSGENFTQIITDFTARDKELVLKLISYEDVVGKAGASLQPHLIANYLLDIARNFHHYYSETRVFSENNFDKKYFNIYLATKSVIEKGLYLLGVEPINEEEEM